MLTQYQMSLRSSDIPCSCAGLRFLKYACAIDATKGDYALDWLIIQLTQRRIALLLIKGA